MSDSRSRFSHRHLLALCTFLVPLLVLAVLGYGELQRSGSQAQAAIERESRQFLQSAAQSVEQQIDRVVSPLLAETERLVHDLRPLRTTLRLRADPRFHALLDIVTLDDQLALIWPPPPPASTGLPLARDARARGDAAGGNALSGALQAADLLATTGRYEQLVEQMQRLLGQIAEASPQGRTGRRFDLDEAELQARFRLATALRKLGNGEAARAEFERVRTTVANSRWRNDSESQMLMLMAETALAELEPAAGGAAARLQLLRQIAEGRRDFLADGLLGAIADRLAGGIPAETPEHDAAQQLLREETERERARSFAATYDLVFKFALRWRRLRESDQAAAEPRVTRFVSTLAGVTTLLCVRPATAEEAEKLHCASVGVRIDLGGLVTTALEQFQQTDNTFVLAVDDPDDVPVVPTPKTVPADFVPPARAAGELTLRAYPANTARLAADAQAAARNRALLLIALFVTAVGGALWLWRSVSREAELANLKVDLVSRVSHELKTPLALIRMYGETLGMGRARDPGQAAEFGGIIARESERLTALIQRILDFSRQQAGTLDYAPAAIDLAALLRTVCDAYTPHLEARGAILVETLRPNIHVHCDANACESAVVNLLENAAKYGRDEDSGDHEIELDLRAADGEAVIEVRDRGRGVPADERERVFDGFYRASNAGDVRGAGLGLSLVRHFARAHGGEATVAPRPGGGSVFRISLPLVPPPSYPSSAAPANPRDAAATEP